MAKNPDVIVIGGGVVGASCALAIAKRNCRVVLLDAGITDGVATPAAAGMLGALAEASPNDDVLALHVRARDIYSQLVPELQDETGIDIEMWTEGILQAVFTDSEVARLKSAVARLRQSGLPADWLSLEEMLETAPGLSPDILGGVFAPDDGSLNPIKLHEALLESASRRGVEIQRDTRAIGVGISSGSVVSVETDKGELGTGAAVVAAGCWSGRLSGLPRPLSVEPVKGQMAVVALEQSKPRSIVYGANGYVLTNGKEAMLGATVEHAGYDTTVTDEGIAWVKEAAAEIFPELADAPTKRSWSGLRPGTPDGVSIIGADPDVCNLWYATGHGRNGILMAGLTGHIIGLGFGEQEIDEEISLAPVDPGRFWKTHPGRPCT
jgi:glycine oxidase